MIAAIGKPAARTAAAAIALVAITLAAYWPVLGNGYVWDDDAYVTRNPTLRTADGLRQIWFDVGATPQYYPLAFTSFWLEYQAVGLNPAVSHAINVLLHIAAALAAWRVLLVVGLPAAAAWLAALVFAVHPVHVESVAWIAERKNVLSGVCYLGAMWAYLRFDELVAAAGSARSRRAWMLYALSFLMFLLALFSKTVTATLPCAILLVLWYRRGKIGIADVGRLTPFLVVGMALGLLTAWLERAHVGAVGREWELTLVERMLVAGRAVWFYAGKLAWPYPLVFVYPRWQVDTTSTWQYLFPLAAAGVVVALWGLRGRWGRGPLAAVLFFIGTLVPALGFFNVFPMRYSFVADHFQYLASLGLLALAAVLAWHGYRAVAPAMRGIAAGAAVVCVTALAVLTWRQVHVYEDRESLWRDTLAKNPASWMAAHNLGTLYLERRQPEQAQKYFEDARRLRPEDPRVYNNLGSLRLMQGDVPGAMAYFEQAIDLEPHYVGARLNLAQTLLARGDARRASGHYLHALAVDGRVGDLHEQLALHVIRGLGPGDNEMFLEDALRIRPGWPLLVNELAWIMATSPDPGRRNPERAVVLAQRAVELSGGRDPNLLDTLAAAHAARGDFERAGGVAARALELARQRGDDALAAEIESRRERYRRGQADQAAPGTEQQRGADPR